MTEVYLNISERRKRFKDSMGQANHFLITALIGLEYINNNEVSCPESFSTSWNPKNKKSSVERTRLYILKSSLSWAIDCLDTYLSQCNQEPKLISDINLINDFNGKGRSVNGKFSTLIKYINPSENIEDFNIYKSLVGLAIQWRNNTMHSGGNNIIEDEYKKILLSSADKIKELFCGLDIEITLNSFDEKRCPTFKEVTSLIRGIQRFIEIIDICIITNIDIQNYACSIIDGHFRKHNIKVSSMMSLPKEKCRSKVVNILKAHSFSEVSTTEKSPKVEIDNIIEQWAKQ